MYRVGNPDASGPTLPLLKAFVFRMTSMAGAARPTLGAFSTSAAGQGPPYITSDG